ncbi:hypothetical protein ACPUEN_11755 [Algoriphagus yeomjeoni]|uniref:hypothetical protein n=1 Tax=Algoriphagus yeomjeoni TaxID=291403 RepID=UPI003CE4B4B2
MSVIDEIIDGEFQKQQFSIPAQRLKDKLLPIPSKASEMSRRWFWELLQNASDITNSVNIKLLIEEDFITFEHDGGPFRIIDALNLIAPDTGKDTKLDPNIPQIGKFGSGQVSTHVLSGILEVDGILLESDEYYKFSIKLDRTEYSNKDFLIDSIKTSKAGFNPKKLVETYSPQNFPTKFKYHLKSPIASIDPKTVVKDGLTTILDQLPFTMAFLPKVKSVTIENKSNFYSDFKNFKIQKSKEENNLITYTANIDSKPKDIKLLWMKEGEVETAVLIDNGDLAAYPNNSPKYFCGLPLIGTEEIGLPIPIHSYLFETTQERESIEISPSDTKNRELLKSANKLYKNLLQKCVELEFKNIFHVTKMQKKYLGAEGSKIHFKEVIIQLFKESLNQSKAIINRRGDRIIFSEFILPFRLGTNDLMFDVGKALRPSNTCPDQDYESWIPAIDADLFAVNRVGYDRLMAEVIKYSNLNSIILEEGTNPKNWLKMVISLILKVDDSHFKKYRVFPNKELELCFLENLNYSKDLPEKLVQIHDELTNSKLGKSILDKDFEEFHHLFPKSKEVDEIGLCNLIDNALQKKYSESQNNTSVIIGPLRAIFAWCDQARYTKEELKKRFEWFEKKRAILFLETFDDKERELALSISQSGKLEALAKLAESTLTGDQLMLLAENPSLFQSLLNGQAPKVDDQTYANEEIGNQGEELVFSDLMRKFPTGLGFQVIWASKLLGEARFDFEVKKGSETIAYIDAKTTGIREGINGSIPFFVRPAQWNFLKDSMSYGKYFISRVFLKPTLDVKYLKTNLITEINNQ